MYSKAMIGIVAFILISSTTDLPTSYAEPSDNMKAILADSVSVMDFLSYQLKKELDEEYNDRDDCLYSVSYLAEKIGDKELISEVKKRIEDRKLRVPSLFIFRSYFDFASNRFAVDIGVDVHEHETKSQARSVDPAEAEKEYEKGRYKRAAEYWESYGQEVEKTTRFVEPSLLQLQQEKYPIGEVKSKGQLYRREFPRYEALRLNICRKVSLFQMHYGYTKASYDEDVVKKELVKRLRIRIFYTAFYSPPRMLLMEFSDGQWKKRPPP